MPPTTAQQRGTAFAPMPFAAISFLSSSYVIYHLLFQESQKRKRLYHRLVLAMNFALLFMSVSNFWGAMAVPEGTPNYAGAMGTMETCTAQGFMNMMLAMTVATYYASLVLQAFLGIRNNFNQEKYRWIEIPIHLIAYCIPCAYVIVIAATENINPGGSGCFYSKAPRGCESDPDIMCQRGLDLGYFEYIIGLSQMFLYFVFPPSVIMAVHCWMKKLEKERSRRRSGRGMTIVRDEARKKMMRSVYLQIAIYLSSFWFTFMLTLIEIAYEILTRETAYNLRIVANCVYQLQGFVFMVVYFTLQKMGRGPKVEDLHTTLSSRESPHGLSVSDIRSSAERKAENGVEEVANNVVENFNIFDGVPDPDSPWARYMYSDDDSDDEDAPDDREQPVSNESNE